MGSDMLTIAVNFADIKISVLFGKLSTMGSMCAYGVKKLGREIYI
jgi:hypothetical protein